MAGFREFVTGEVLTAANVDDFLMKQTVQKYADAAARDAALGTAVAGGNALREGMVAYLDDTNDVLKYDGTAWTTVGNAGIGSNLVYTRVSAVFSTTSTTFTPVTNFEGTITPTSTASQVLVVASFRYSTSAAAAANARLMRGVTQVETFGSLGDVFAAHASSGINFADVTQVFLDSPNTTSATTYSIEVFTSANTLHIGTRGDGSAGQRRDYTLTLIEVAA